MDKSQHLVTVPREYLEMLEDYFESNQTEFNAKISRTIRNGAYLTLLQTDETSKVVSSIVLIGSNGKEHATYQKV